ncbi:MAG TPA: hypothetical protein VKI62_04300, partial [Bacteroidota bacterium]|nr:hypothetical protein [Bacteroidota bacterium]
MAFIQEEPKHPIRVLILVGIPAFILAVCISIISHQFIHKLVDKSACSAQTTQAHLVSAIDSIIPHTTCPLSSAAAALWTFCLALVSFTLYLRFPRNLFFGAMAFVNASIRLPETITVFLQLLFNTKNRLMVDESRSLALLRLHDPTISVVLMSFFSLTVLFLTITIVHDTKTIRWKWAVAFGSFLILSPLQNVVWN